MRCAARKYLLLERRDQLAQAISRTIALAKWSLDHGAGLDVPDSALVFDRAAIDLEMAMKIASGAAPFPQRRAMRLRHS